MHSRSKIDKLRYENNVENLTRNSSRELRDNRCYFMQKIKSTVTYRLVHRVCRKKSRHYHIALAVYRGNLLDRGRGVPAGKLKIVNTEPTTVAPIWDCIALGTNDFVTVNQVFDTKVGGKWFFLYEKIMYLLTNTYEMVKETRDLVGSARIDHTFSVDIRPTRQTGWCRCRASNINIQSSPRNEFSLKEEKFPPDVV